MGFYLDWVKVCVTSVLTKNLPDDEKSEITYLKEFILSTCSTISPIKINLKYL